MVASTVRECDRRVRTKNEDARCRSHTCSALSTPTDKGWNPFIGFLVYLTIQNKYVIEIKMQIEKVIKKFYLCVRNY